MIAGFAVVFGLWVLSGYELVRRLAARSSSARQPSTSRRFAATRLLTTIRTNVLLGSIYLRDAIIDNRSMNVDYYRQELNKIRGEIDRLLPAYVVDVTSRRSSSIGPSSRKSSTNSGNHVSWRLRRGVPLDTTEAAVHPATPSRPSGP